MPHRVLAVGDINIDLILTGLGAIPRAEQEVLALGVETVVGGQTGTFARALSSLGADVVFFGKVGDDEYGRKAIEQLRQDGVDPSGVIIDPALKTGITVVLSTGSERAYATYLGSIGELRRADICYAQLQRADHIHVGSYYLQTNLRSELADLFSAAHRLGLTTSLDPGWDLREAWEADIIDVLKHVDVFMPNEVEAVQIAHSETPEEALEVLSQYARVVVLKRGARGCLAKDRAQTVSYPAYDVHVVDVTSAGDVFSAGFVYAFLNNWELDTAAQFANACGAIAVTRVGSSGIISSVQEVENLIRTGHYRSTRGG